MDAIGFIKSRPNVPLSVRRIARELGMKRKTVEYQLSNYLLIEKCNAFDVGSMKTKVNCFQYKS